MKQTGEAEQFRTGDSLEMADASDFVQVVVDQVAFFSLVD